MKVIRKAIRTLNNWWSKALDILGDIKIFKYPFFVVYDPSYFKMTGIMIDKALEILQPGDIVLRGYDCYLDGHFIDGDYSHGAIYIGDKTIIHAISPVVCRTHAIDFMECDRIAIFRPKCSTDKAISQAEKFADDKVPYDFFFDSSHSDRLYCFELVTACYPEIEFKKFTVKKLFGLI